MTTNPLMPVMPVEAGEGETTAQKRARSRPSAEEITAWLLLGSLIVYTLWMHLVPAVVGGLGLYLVLEYLAQLFSRRIPGTAARPLALILVTLVGGGLIVGSIAFAVSFLRHHVDRIPAMMTQMAEILRTTRVWLGGYGQQVIPEVMTDAEAIKGAVVDWLKAHADTLKVAGGTISIGVVMSLT